MCPINMLKIIKLKNFSESCLIHNFSDFVFFSLEEVTIDIMDKLFSLLYAATVLQIPISGTLSKFFHIVHTGFKEQERYRFCNFQSHRAAENYKHKL